MGYYVHHNDETTGPFSEEEILGKFRTGKIQADTLVAKEGDITWTPLSQIGLTLSTPEPSAKSTTESDSEPLQFDRAEFENAPPASAKCAVCKQPIQDSYYYINRLVACGQCKEKVETSGAGRLTLRGFGKSFAFGLGAAIGGSAIWYAVRELTGYELGLIGIVVGLMVGVTVRHGSRGWGGWPYQTLAMALTYLAIAGTYIPPIYSAMHRHESRAHRTGQAAASDQQDTTTHSDNADEPASSDVSTNSVPSDPKPGQHSLVATALRGLPRPIRKVVGWSIVSVVVLAFACAVPFLAGVSNFMGWIIIAIALYEAWKINRRVPLEITGPYKIGASGPPS